MSMETALVALKTANSALTSLIGARFHPDSLPQGVTLPAVRFQEISSVKADAMAPSIVNHKTRVQMDGYAASVVARAALREAIIGAFYGQSGTFGGEFVKSILIDGERKGIEMLDTNTQGYRVSIDFKVDLA